MSGLIRLARACLGTEELEAIANVLDDGYLGMGQQVMLFEQELEAFFSGTTKVACVNTGTSAIQLALQACGINSEAEVLIPSITYVSSFQATSAIGAKPVACDIDLETGCLDIEDVKRKITPRTRAIMHVHYAGGVGDRSSIFAFAKEHNLRVIEDGAHSFGGCHKGRRIGETGDITCFSFGGIKNITCGEGGAVVSGDSVVIEKVCDLRLLGVQKDTDKRYAGEVSWWDFDVEEQGWRYHMTNLNAAIGRTQLKKIGFFGAKRRALANLYKDKLEELPLQILDLDLENIIPHTFPVLVPNQKRDTLKVFLAENQIVSGIHFKPNHLLKKYSSTLCPKAEYFGKNVLSLPLHVMMTEEDVQRVCRILKEYFQ